MTADPTPEREPTMTLATHERLLDRAVEWHESEIERLEAAIREHREAHGPTITQPGIPSIAQKANAALWEVLSDDR